MKSILIKTAAIAAIGLIAATSAARAAPMNSDSSDQQGSVPQKVEQGAAHVAKTTYHGAKRIARDTVHGSRHIAHATVRDSRDFAQSSWDMSKRIGRTVVDSPVIAYHVVRGDRPLFTHERRSGREQVALTGHRTMEKSDAARHNEPPI
jgi:hypothetical protein